MERFLPHWSISSETNNRQHQTSRKRIFVSICSLNEWISLERGYKDDVLEWKDWINSKGGKRNTKQKRDSETITIINWFASIFFHSCFFFNRNVSKFSHFVTLSLSFEMEEEKNIFDQNLSLTGSLDLVLLN